jgi:hypothetical protein
MSLLSDYEVAHPLSLRGVPCPGDASPHSIHRGTGNPFSRRNAGLNSFD